MNIFIKVAPRYYERLRGQIPNQSPAREAIDKATRIDHAVEGCCLKATTFPVTKTKRASFSKQPSNPAPRLSATLRKSLGSPDATDRPVYDVTNGKRPQSVISDSDQRLLRRSS
mgnify:CR=1 FL=1